MNERRQDSGYDGPRSTTRVDGWLRSARGPALVIAPGDAMLIAANPAGARLLGIEADLEHGIPLDSAMPAIMDLRRVLNRVARGRGPLTPLVFWTPDGIARLHCHFEVIENDYGQRLVLVEVASEPTQAGVASVALNAAPEPPPAESEPPLRREDAEKPAVSTGGITAHSPSNDVSTDRDRVRTGTPREVPTPPTAAHRADKRDPVNASAPSSQSAAGGPVRASQPSHRRALVATPEPAPPPPAVPPQARSDDDTLKAIARQILAGRRATSNKGADSLAHKSADTPVRPNGAAPPRSREATGAAHAGAAASARARAGYTSRPAPASKAATQSTSKDLRRSDSSATRAPSQSKSDTYVADLPATPPKPGKPVRSAADAQPARPEHEADRGGGIRPTRARRVAHELKTPLSAIVSAAEVMKDQRLGSIGDDRYLRYAQDIYESARHALAVIERMLGQPRKDAGDRSEGELSFTNLDLNALAVGLISGLTGMAQEAELTLTSDLALRLPLVVADATSVRQILLNLLTNALKFTPPGGEVRLSTRIDEDGQLALSVSDTGPGISTETLARLASERGGTAMEVVPQQRPGGGLGIGLPLARKLASANGASLEILLGDGGGTVVTLAFPSSRQVPI